MHIKRRFINFRHTKPVYGAQLCGNAYFITSIDSGHIRNVITYSYTSGADRETFICVVIQEIYFRRCRRQMKHFMFGKHIFPGICSVYAYTIINQAHILFQFPLFHHRALIHPSLQDFFFLMDPACARIYIKNDIRNIAYFIRSDSSCQFRIHEICCNHRNDRRAYDKYKKNDIQTLMCLQVIY